MDDPFTKSLYKKINGGVIGESKQRFWKNFKNRKLQLY